MAILELYRGRFTEVITVMLPPLEVVGAAVAGGGGGGDDIETKTP